MLPVAMDGVGTIVAVGLGLGTGVKVGTGVDVGGNVGDGVMVAVGVSSGFRARLFQRVWLEMINAG